MDKKNLIIALEKAIKKMDKKGDKEVFNDLLVKLKRCSELYTHYIENRLYYWWLIDHHYIEKSVIDAIGGGR